MHVSGHRPSLWPMAAREWPTLDIRFGPQVDRKSAKVHGVRSYVYCGIRKKMMGNTAKRPCLEEAPTSPEGTGAVSSSTVDHLLQQVMQLNEELRREKQYRQDLETKLQHSQSAQKDMEAMLQSQRIPWDKVHAEIDSELVTLQRVGGMMSHGPVNIADPRSLTD